MSDKTPNSFFMFPPVMRYAGFYQELLSGIGTHQQLGNRLISIGERAHSLRQFDKVKEIGLLLSNIPIKRYQAIGNYFLAVAANSMGNGDQNEAKSLFERVVDTAPDEYKSKAILSLGAIGFNKRDFDSALYYYREAIRSERLGTTTIQAIRGIALLKSIEGYHKSAIADLEQIFPVIRFAPPLIYFDYLNSYAVELGEAGRTYEARNVCNAVLASPFIIAYPEWQQTAQDLREANRSIVAVHWSQHAPAQRTPAKVLMMPVRDVDFAATDANIQPARILEFEEWKKKMVKDKEDDGENEPVSLKDMFLKIMNAYASDTTTDEQRYKIYEAVMKVMREPKPEPPPPDDPQGA